MAKRVRCPCGGNPDCKLCGGSRFYDYDPGPRGWLPFPCPTCGGVRVSETGLGAPGACLTCKGAGDVDPADPPSGGPLDVIWKALFGA